MIILLLGLGLAAAAWAWSALGSLEEDIRAVKEFEEQLRRDLHGL